MIKIRRHKINADQLTDFAHQLATLLDAGIPLVTALTIIADSTTHLTLQRLVLHIKQQIQMGNSLTEALWQYPQYFNGLYCNLIAIGEQSGTLTETLHLLTSYRSKVAQFKENLRKAFIYPCCVLCVAVLVTLGLLVWVVPRFQQLFQAVGASLPIFTCMIIVISNAIRHWGWLILLFTLLISIILKIAAKRWFLHLPLVGNLTKHILLARITRTLALSNAAGMPLIKSLQAVASIAHHALYQHALLRVKQAVINGDYLHQALQETKLFPARVIQMVAIGEQSGTLDPMLIKLAEYYETEVDKTTTYLSKIAEPVLLLMISILVGSVMIAMYLPLFRLSAVI